MKKLLVLLLLSYTFSSSLLAKSLAQTIPLALQQKLCDQLANNENRCDNGSTLTYYTHSNLNNGNLLLFIYLNNHTAKMFKKPEAVIPVVVDQLGRWISTVGENIITEDIQSINQDPHGNIWVRAEGQIEGAHPAFYHSRNGLSWKQTVLPENRNIDCCFEYVNKPIFLYDSITLTFRNAGGTRVRSWSTDYESAMSNTPFWQPVSNVPSSSIDTLPNPSWKSSKTKSKITFLNIYSNKSIYLPLKYESNKKVYQIQVGAYATKSAAKKAQKSLLNIPYFSQIVKSKKYEKLLIGKFTTFKKAKTVLAKLKREHPKNKAIQRGFVLKSI